MAAFYPLAFAAEQIAGGRADVRNLTPAGAEPHDLELTAGDVRAVDEASLVLYLGDGFMPGLETAVSERQGRRSTCSPGCGSTSRLRRGGAGGRSPRLARSGALRRDGAADRRRRSARQAPAARSLARRLDALDAEYRRGLAHCARRQIVTSHAAFGYLAARYGLEQVPLEGLSPEAEPSARDIARLVDARPSSGATTVFFETLLSPKLARDGRARGRRRRRPCSTRSRGSARARSRPGPTTSPSCARTSPRCGRRSDARAEQPVVELDGVSFGYRAGCPGARGRLARRRARASSSRSPGPNGGGKTTLLRLVLGLERPSEGRCACSADQPGRGREGGRIGYLPQRSRLLGEAPVTVREIVSTGRLAPAGIWGPLRRADRDAVARAIETVGSHDRADAPLRTLSGGMQQRALIAKALASEPDAARARRADDGCRRRVAGSLGAPARDAAGDLGVTILYVSHEFGAVEHVVDRIVLVRGGDRLRRAARAGSPACGTTRLINTTTATMLDLEFMRLALATGAVVGLLAPAVGFFLVERKASLIGDGLGHVAFAGVAFGYLLGISPVLTALVAAVRRGAHDRVAAHARRRGGRPGARARLLHRHRRRRRPRLARRRAQRQPLPVPVRLDPHRHAQRPLDRARARDRRARDDRHPLPRPRRHGARRGRQPRRRRARDAAERRRRRPRRAHRRRLDADRRHPPDRGADGAARDRRQPGRLEPAVDVRAVDGVRARLGHRRASASRTTPTRRPAARSSSSPPGRSRSAPRAARVARRASGLMG